MNFIYKDMKTTKDNSVKADKKNKVWIKRTEGSPISKEIKVEEIENGFIITTEEWGDKNDKYFHSTKKFYSKDNPLADDDMVMDSDMNDAINDFIQTM